MSRANTTPNPAEEVTYKCTCGKMHVVSAVEHYDRLILSCGARVWALRPLRNGPLILRPWPGPAITPRELEAREAANSALRTPNSSLI